MSDMAKLLVRIECWLETPSRAAEVDVAAAVVMDGLLLLLVIGIVVVVVVVVVVCVAVGESSSAVQWDSGLGSPCHAVSTEGGMAMGMGFVS